MSVNHVERFALLCGFAVERVRFDYGIDLIVHTYNERGEIENGRILFQVKATDQARIHSKARSVPCRFERADLLYWLGESMPMILVQYDAQLDRAYWLHVQRHCESWTTLDFAKAGKHMRLPIPIANILDAAAMREMARRKNEALVSMKGERNAN